MAEEIGKTLLWVVVGMALGVLAVYRTLLYREDIASELSDSIVEDDDIIHVGYTAEQMGYDK